MPAFRDRFLSLKFPNGPRNSLSTMEAEWFKKKTTIFLTSAGTPVNRVNLEDFSLLAGIQVVPGDLRKKFTTELAHHRKQVRFTRFENLSSINLRLAGLWLG